jgi:hypothetical protein
MNKMFLPEMEELNNECDNFDCIENYTEPINIHSLVEHNDFLQKMHNLLQMLSFQTCLYVISRFIGELNRHNEIN